MCPHREASVVRYPGHVVAPLVDPEARSYLTAVGLPGEHLLFRAFGPDEVTVEDRGGRRVLCLGKVGSYERLCVDTGTGEVLSVPDSGSAWHVNDTVVKFARSLEAFSARFPFHSADAELEEREAAADELKAALLEIDPTAFKEDPGYWYLILHDVAVGDYADE